MTDDNSSSPQSISWQKKLANMFSSGPQSKKDFTDLLNSARANNIIDHDALEIIERALNVCDKQVREIMVPRSQMAVIPQHLELNDTLKLVIENRHSRYPVLDETADHIIGILLAKELLPLLLEGQDAFNIKNIIRPAAIVPESKRLNILLKEFREQRYHMAIVVDEYGGIAGLITIEDILEEIVGEIQDETDETEQAMITPRGQAGYFIQALTLIEDFNEYFNADVSADEFDTIGGIIVQAFGRMPKVGENIDIGIFKFRISEGNDRQIKLLEMEVVPKNTSA